MGGGGSGWGIHVTPWLIHVNVLQNPLKCCEVISLQLIKINLKKKRKGKNLQLRLQYPAKTSFKTDGERKSFSDKQKLREFSTTKPALQQMLNGLT